MVCRVFHKCSTAKKPQQAQSSQPSFVDSPGDTNTVTNEFGDIELPNLNSNIANSSSAMSHISLHNFNNGGEMVNSSNLNMNLNMNWPATASSAIQTLSSWPSGLLTPNLSMNSLLLRALQLRSFQQQREATNNIHDFSSYNMPTGISQFGTDFSSNFPAGGSSSKGLDSAQQPQGPQQPHQEQPFNLDSMW